MAGKRQRLDLLLVERGLVPTCAEAQAHLMAGEVFVDGRRAEKPGQQARADADVEIRPSIRPYVSRGGEKLAGALDAFGIDVSGKVALDVGSSTGGFCDCLLRRGAARVYAVDVGRGQLDWGLRGDERVVVMEGVNARNLEPGDLPEPVDLAALDLSFISLTKVLPAVLPLVREGGHLLPLIKPQFEVERGLVGKGGVVRDPRLHRDVLRRIGEFLYNSGAEVAAAAPSPLRGPKGNREFFFHAVRRTPAGPPDHLERLIEKAVDEQD